MKEKQKNIKSISIVISKPSLMKRDVTCFNFPAECFISIILRGERKYISFFRVFCLFALKIRDI